MTRLYRFHQLDVFTEKPLLGNPLAVVHDADDLDDSTMQAFARWTNLSETTFLLRPTDPRADYRVRIFTPGGELPFAGHPTLGSCHAWLAAGGVGKHADQIIQQCGVGLVPVRRSAQRLAFGAPALRRSGPLDDTLVQRILKALRLRPEQLLAHQWVDNGSGWCAVQLDCAATVLALRPDMSLINDLKLGVVGAYPSGHDLQFEVRAFVGPLGMTEDPVTGSLNAGLAQWLVQSGRAPDHYVASQGTVLGRQGRVHVSHESSGFWIGGDVVICVEGQVRLT